MCVQSESTQQAALKGPDPQRQKNEQNQQFGVGNNRIDCTEGKTEFCKQRSGLVSWMFQMSQYSVGSTTDHTFFGAIFLLATSN